MGHVAELVAPRRFVVEERPPAAPGGDEVRIAVHACGVCGSDVQRFTGKARQYPIVLGHEIAGLIDVVGSTVSRLRRGDPVVAVPLIPCDECPACSAGDYALCEQYGFLGSRQTGGFATTVTVPERNVLRVPEAVAGPASALVEPLAIGSAAILRARTVPGDSVVVVGAGAIGLCAAFMAEAAGAADVTVLDVARARVAHAARLGFAAHLLAGTEAPPVLGSVVVEAAGSPAALQTALRVARSNARVACVGTMHKDVHLPVQVWELVLRKQLSLIGVWNSYTAPFPGMAWSTAVAKLSKDAGRVSQLVTHRFALAQAQQCFDWMLAHPGEYGKVVLIPSHAGDR